VGRSTSRPCHDTGINGKTGDKSFFLAPGGKKNKLSKSDERRSKRERGGKGEEKMFYWGEGEGGLPFAMF